MFHKLNSWILTQSIKLGQTLAMVLTMSAAVAPRAAYADQVTVFAAASLRDALQEVGNQWQTETGHSLRFSFAGSSALARQIEAGAPADLVLLANSAWMDHLMTQGALLPGSQTTLLSNQLVLIGPKGAPPLTLTPETIRQRLGKERLAMALVNAVPAGIYGKAALETLTLWPDLAPQVAQTDNVRAALALVALGETPLGIVYTSDLLVEPRVERLATFPKNSHPPIRYPLAQTIEGTSEAASDLYHYLQTPIAKDVFLRHGFSEPAS
jgi:molybdate transport system substrate-binding protein